jgi:hypothetical protein|nr:MAG TPA: hypothetical protein [Caudoviricetes sp.]
MRQITINLPQWKDITKWFWDKFCFPRRKLIQEWLDYHNGEIARFDRIGLQKITMTYSSEDAVPQCWVDGHKVPVETVAANDGLSTEDFVNWFFGRNPENFFEGVVIHFTDFRY